jgi:arabinogalactan oligomer / maltooligosaccharide transport system substrate-binding protein
MHKRAIGAAAVTGVAALFMSACGGSSTPAADKTPAPSGSSTTTTAAAPAEASPTTTGAPARDASADLVIWADADRAPRLKTYADQFGEENGIKVAVQVVTDTRVQFKDATNVGKGPDVVVGAHDWLGELVQNGTVAPVPLSADVAAKFDPKAIAATKYNGQQYGVPYAVENIALMRNTALAPEAPKTMDELVATGEKIKKSNKKVTNVLVQQVGKVGNAYYTYPYLSAFGGGIFATKANGDYDPSKVIVNSAESLKGANEIAKLGKAKVLSTNVDDTNAEGIFDGGKAPFFFTGPWATPNAKKAGIKYAISPLPSIDGKPMQPFLGVQMFYVSAKAKNAAFAQEFVTNYVSRKDVQLALFQAGGRPPALKEAYDEVAKNDKDVQGFHAAGLGGKSMPNIPAMNSVWAPLGQAAADVISGKAKVDARFAAAQKEIVSNIKKG